MNNHFFKMGYQHDIGKLVIFNVIILLFSLSIKNCVPFSVQLLSSICMNDVIYLIT